MFIRKKKLRDALERMCRVQADRNLLPDELIQLEALLDALFDLGPKRERKILTELSSLLADDFAALVALESEVEMHAQLLTVGEHRELNAVLMAIPLVFPAGDHRSSFAASTDVMHFLVEHLKDHHLVDDQALVALAPRLFTAEELFGQSFGTLRALNLSMADSLMADEPVRLLPDQLDIPFPVDDIAIQGNGDVELRYLIGVAVVPANQVENVFPDEDTVDIRVSVNAQAEMALGHAPAASDGFAEANESDDHDDEGIATTAEEAMAALMGGCDEPVETAFRELVSDAFQSLFGCVAALPPADLAEGLRLGLELQREASLRLQVTGAYSGVADVRIVGQAYEEENESYGWTLALVDDSNVCLEVVQWPVLDHESPEDSEGMLRGLADEQGWAILEMEAYEAEN